MDDRMDRSQPPQGPTEPDDRRNYEAGALFGQMANALKAGWNHAVTFATTVRTLTSLRVGSGSTTLAADDGLDGVIAADGANAAFVGRDRATNTKYFIWYENGTIRLNTQQSGDVWLIDPTTGFVTLATAGGWVKVAGGVGYTNSWTDFDATETTDWQVAYKKYPDGTVGLRGVMKSGTIATTAFTLPVGYRPLKRALVVGLDGANTGQDVQIFSTGGVAPLTGSNTFFSLTGIRFDTQ